MTRNMTMKQLATAAGIAAVALLAVWYLALWKPQTHKLAAAHKADAAAQVQISGLHQQVNQLQALEKEIPADKVKLAKYQQAIPTNPELSAAIRSIQAAATTTGVSLNSLAPTVPTSNSSSGRGSVSGATTIPVTISAQGTYAGLTAFIQALTSMPRTLVIQSTSLGGKGTTMTLSIAASMFYTGS